MSDTPFIHLHTHSHYSLLDGLSSVDEMVDLAKEYGMPAVGLTDHGALYGAIDFYKKCKKEDIKPIIGVEAYMANRTRHDKQPGIDNKRYHLTLLAQNNTGYSNIVKLVSAAYLEGYYYKPRIDKDLLREHAEGVICLSGCLGGELANAIADGNDERAEAVIQEYVDIFGRDRYFVEIMHHPEVDGYPAVRKKLIELARAHNLSLVGTQDSHYLHHDDVRAHETLLAVQQNTDLDDSKRLSLSNDDFSFIDTPTAYEYFSDIPEAVENTKRIADMCEVELSLGSWVFPDFRVDENTTYDDELRRITYEGLSFRNMEKTDQVVERIEYELDIIQTKGFSPYFLAVGDLLRFARENGILTNTRGSAAGSLVSYLIGITNVDPLYFKLPFERFLNPERPKAPDIDMDFADNRRDEVIQYARDKYGEDHVAQIGTFGTMMAKGAVRDVARALGHPYATSDEISRLIPLGAQGFPMTIEKAMKEVPELKEKYDTDSTAKEILDLAQRLEGTVRHVSVHAAGVVISPDPLVESVPIQHDPRGGRIITQYDMHGVEDIGLLKFDFLGIRNLTILENAVRLARHHHNVEIDIENLSTDDPKTYEMLARGETMGLFQLNGSGMTKYLMELKPACIEDINAMIALYRPGPIAFIPEYIKRKENPSLVTYLDDRMRDILDQSYGIITYQDDVLMIAIKLAGYSWLDADKFRKAIGKKIPEEMAAQKEKFTKGCLENGMKESVVQELWDQIETFAAYGFNKAHAASYGNLAYKTAYMKANYPTEYMTAVLTADSGDTEKIAEIITECTRMEIPVLPPDINASYGDFTIIRDNNRDEIRFGLYSVKNLGSEISDAIIVERNENGRFTSLANFLERIQHRNLNKKSMEALIKSGAVDALGDRGQMLANLDDLLAYNRDYAKSAKNQSSLFGELADAGGTSPDLTLKEAEPTPHAQKLAWEKDLLGLYISGHPIDKYREKLTRLGLSIAKIKEGREGVTAIAGGIVEEAKEITTAKGARMAFAKITDHTDDIELVIFPNKYEEYNSLFEQDAGVMVKGKTSHRNGGRSIIVDKAKTL